MKKFVSALILLFIALFAPSFVAAATSGEIKWEVVDRFRLFGRGQPSEVTDLLNNLRTTGTLETSYEAVKHSLVEGLGGPAEVIHNKLAFHGVNAEGALRNLGEANYLYPPSYQIEARWDGAPAGDICQWRFEGRTLPPVSCNSPIKVTVASDKTAGHRDPSLLAVSASTSQVAPAPTSIVIRDRLIAGLGDSFASGEGNPDRPTAWHEDIHGAALASSSWFADGFLISDFLPHWKRTYAEWIDVPCHRSLLNDQVIAALKVAADHPHDAVTLVHVACTGAGIFDGLLHSQFGSNAASQLEALETIVCRGQPLTGKLGGPYSAPEHSRWQHEHQPNIAATVKTCNDPNKRPVDLVFLSIGGNDSGFAGVMAWAILPTEAVDGRPVQQLTTQIANSKEVICPGFPEGVYNPIDERHPSSDPRCVEGYTATDFITNLSISFDALNDALAKIGISESKVIHMQYPYPHLFAENNACPGDAIQSWEYGLKGPPYNKEVYTPGLDTFKGLLNIVLSAKTRQLVIDEPKMSHVKAKVIVPLSTALSAFDIKYNWTRTDDRTDVWNMIRDHHGWCATRETTTKSQRAELRGPVYAQPGEQSFDPYDALRSRWFRTPNDSIIIQYRGVSDSIAGSLHPSLSAHLAMADILAAKANQLIGNSKQSSE